MRLLARPGILQMPGAHNGMAALQAKAAGFEALYLSGAAMTASMGMPDLGMITVDEVCFFVRQITRATGLPLLVDGDTGYGEALNVMHMVRSFEDAGAAAVHIEDQLLPKKCGHLNDKKLADAHDMAAKIAAARRARRHLFIVARTDAAASEGMDGAVARAKLYLEAGADAIFPEALTTAEMFREFAARVDAPLLANMTEFGRTPFFTAAEFQDMGYRMVIWPVSSLRVANKAQEELYAAIRRDGGTHAMVDRMQTRAELYAAIGYHDYEALDATIVKTVIPEGDAAARVKDGPHEPPPLCSCCCPRAVAGAGPGTNTTGAAAGTAEGEAGDRHPRRHAARIQCRDGDQAGAAGRRADVPSERSGRMAACCSTGDTARNRRCGCATRSRRSTWCSSMPTARSARSPRGRCRRALR